MRASPRQRRDARRLAVALRVGLIHPERRFVRELRGILAGVHDTMLAFLTPAMHALTNDSTKGRPTGNAAGDVDAVIRHVVPQIGPKVDAAHQRLTKSVTRNYSSTMKKVLPVGWQRLPNNVQIEAHLARAHSIALIENAARSYAQQVKDIFADPSQTLGVPWTQLRDALIERGGVSESRAELIARDQTLKLNGAIAKATQQGAGITSYSWDTSGDERVRDEHAALDGQVFDWASGGDPEEGNPGEAICCRCVAVAIVDLGEDD